MSWVGKTGLPRAVVAAAGLASLMGVSAPALAQKSPTGQAAFLRAQHDLIDNDVTDAAAEMETAVHFEPRFALGWYLLASTSRRIGEYDRAVAAYRRYLELRPNEADPLFGIGLCLEAIGDGEGAIAAWQRYVELEARAQSATYVAQARKQIVELQRARPATAVRPASHLSGAGGAPPLAEGAGGASGQAPPGPDAEPLAAGGRLIAAHKYPEAIEALRTAVKLAPADAPAWYKLAFALRAAGQLPEATKAYRRYITLRPDDPDPYYSLGQVLVASGRQEEALTVFRTYVKTEHRKTETRWLAKARAEIARIESTRKPPAPAEPKLATAPATTEPKSLAQKPTEAMQPVSPPPAQ
ncbi:MAG TPA: tetratricopeptide repeat protein [Polyangia bacterium]